MSRLFNSLNSYPSSHISISALFVCIVTACGQKLDLNKYTNVFSSVSLQKSITDRVMQGIFPAKYFGVASFNTNSVAINIDCGSIKEAALRVP